LFPFWIIGYNSNVYAFKFLLIYFSKSLVLSTQPTYILENKIKTYSRRHKLKKKVIGYKIAIGYIFYFLANINTFKVATCQDFHIVERNFGIFLNKKNTSLFHFP